MEVKHVCSVLFFTQSLSLTVPSQSPFRFEILSIIILRL